MTTLAQYRSAVSSEIGLDNTTAGDQTSIDGWINAGVTDVVMRTNCRVRSASLALAAGTPDYTTDTAILKVFQAYSAAAGANYPLEQVSPEDILAMRIGGTASVSPAQYYAVQGSDLFMIYPTPSSSSDSVTFYYVPRPTTLSVSSDTPSEIPAEFQQAVEYYAEARAASFSDDAGAQMGNFYRQLYEQELRRIKRWVAFKGGHRLPLASRRSAVHRLPLHDRSTY